MIIKEERLSYCKYCKLSKHQCQCTSGEWTADYNPMQENIKSTQLPKHIEEEFEELFCEGNCASNCHKMHMWCKEEVKPYLAKVYKQAYEQGKKDNDTKFGTLGNLDLKAELVKARAALVEEIEKLPVTYLGGIHPQLDKRDVLSLLTQEEKETEFHFVEIKELKATIELLKDGNEANMRIKIEEARQQDKCRSVSQWKEYGKKAGYWDFFEKQFHIKCPTCNDRGKVSAPKEIPAKSPVGKYTFTIRQCDKIFIAKGKTTAEPLGTMITQGKSAREILAMVADAYECILTK